MKLKKLFSIFIIIVLVFSFSLILVACGNDQTNIEDDKTKPKPPVKPTLGYEEVFDKIGNSMGITDANVGTLSNVVITIPKSSAGGVDTYDEYTLSLGSNIVSLNDGLELALRVFKGVQVAGEEDLSKIVFAIYIIDSKVFMEVSGVKISLEDIPVDYIVDILSRLPGFKQLVDSLLGGILDGLSLDTVIDMVFMLLNPTTIHTVVGTTENIGININLSPILSMLPSLLQGINLEAELSKLGIVLPETDVTINGLIGDILELIPAFSIDINAVIENGELDNIDIALLDDYSMPYIKSTAKITFSNDKVNIGIPESFVDYQIFSITNFSFDIDLGANLKQFDLGAFITLLVGDSSPIAAGVAVIDVEDINLKLKINADLDFFDNDKNLISIELFRAYSDGSIVGNPLLGLYYINGAFKVNISSSATNGSIKIPNIIMHGVDITKVFTDLFNNVDVIIQKLINNLVNSKSGESDPSALTNKVSEFNNEVDSDGNRSALGMLASDVIPVAFNSAGNMSISDSISGIFATALKLFGFDNLNNGKQFISNKYNSAGEIIGLNISVGSEFFSKLESLVPGVIVIPDIVKMLSVDLDINWESGGLDSIDISATMPDSNFDAKVDLSINNFNVGFVNKDLRNYIINATTDKEYVGNVKDLINGALDGVDATFNLDIQLHKGEFDITGMLSKFGIKIPEIPVVLDKNYLINTEFTIKLSYDETNPINSKLLIELKLLNDNFPFADKGLLIGLYVQEGVVYIDLSGIKIANITLPKLNFDFDIMSLLAAEINKLDINFILDEIINMISGDKSGGKANYSNSNHRSNVGEVSSDNIFIGINKDLIQLQATNVAITNLLKGFGINLELPKLDISINASGLQDVNVNLNMYSNDGKQKVGIFGQLNKLVIGQPISESDFGMNINVDDYTSNIVQAVKDIAYHLDFTVNLNIESVKSLFNVTDIINNILAASGQRFNVPIKLDLNNLSEMFTLAVKWNLDDLDPDANEIMLEIYSSEMRFDVPPSERKGLFIGVYYKNGTLFVDLSQLGLMKFQVKDINIPKIIDDEINKLITSLDLSVDLNDILGPIFDGILNPDKNPLPGVLMGNNLFANATAQANAINSLNGINRNDGIFDDKNGNPINDILNALLSQISISDSQIFITLMKQILDDGTILDPIKDILADNGIDAGAEIGVGVMLDWFKGALDLDINVDDVTVGVGIKIHNLGTHRKLDWTEREANGFLNEADYADWSTGGSGADGQLTILDTVMGLFSTSSATDSETARTGAKLIMDVDLSIINGLNTTFSYNQLTYVRISKAVRDFGSAEMSLNAPLGRTPQTGDYIIKLYKVTQSGATTGLVHIVVSVKHKTMNILGDVGLFSALSGMVNGSVLNISVPFDLEAMLGGIGFMNTVLPGFDSSGTQQLAASNTDNYPSNPNAPVAGVDINSLFNEIIIKINNDSSINLHADIAGSALSDSLDKIISDLVASMMGPNISYDPTFISTDPYSKSSFIWQAWDKYIVPMIRGALPDLAWILTPDILTREAYRDVYDILSRLVPIPKFEQITVDANIVNGAMHTIKLETFNSNNHKVEAMITNGSQVGVINWAGTPTDIVYDPYDGMDLIETLEGYRPHLPNGKPLSMRNNNTPITYGGDFNALKGMNYNYEPGVYKVTATAFPGDEYEETRNISVTILDDGGGIDYIEDVVVPAFAELPRQVVAVLNDGTRRLIKDVDIINGDKSKGVIEGDDPSNPYKTVYGASVFINNLAYDDITVRYLPDGSDFAGVIETNASEIASVYAKLPSWIFVKVKLGKYYRSMNVNKWDTTNLDKLISDFNASSDKANHKLVTGTTVTITATVNEGKHNEALIKHELLIRSTSVDDVMLDINNKNTVYIDPYQQLYHEATSKLPADNLTTKVASPYPTTSKISYKEGATYRNDTQNIIWSGLDKIDYNAHGGIYSGVSVSNKIIAGSGNYAWTKDLTVNVMSRIPKAIIFGKNADGSNITVQTVNPYDFSLSNQADYFPEYMNVQFSGLDIARAKITWDLTNLTDKLSASGNRIMVKAIVAPSYLDINGVELLSDEIINTYAQTISVPVIIDSVDILNIAGVENVFTINNIGEYFYNGASIESLLPKKLNFTLADGRVISLPVMYNLTGFKPSINGGSSIIKASAIINGVSVKEFDFTIKTTSRTDPKLNNTNSLNINYYDYLVNGLSVFNSIMPVSFGDGSSENLPVVWDTSNVNFTTGKGIAILRIGTRGTSISYKNIKVNVTVENAPNISNEFIPISLANGFDKIIFDTAIFNTNMTNGTLLQLFNEINSWRFNFINEYDVDMTDITWDVSGTSSTNMFVTVRVHTKNGVIANNPTKNVLALYKVKIILK